MPVTRLPNLEYILKDLIGQPYTEAFDCWNFVHLLITKTFPYINLNTDFFAASDYLIEIWSKFDNLQYYNLLQPWDIVLLCVNSPFVNHCGIVLNTEKFANCKESTGVCIEYLSNHTNEMFQIVRLQHLY